MAILNIDEPQTTGPIALWHLGFRPFFLCAGLWAVIAVTIWLGIYLGSFRPPLAGLTPTLWHAHEMIFGYAAAAIAGFLLTAVKNWTNIQTWNRWKLAFLVSLWGIARMLFLLGDAQILPWAIGVSVCFLSGLVIAVALPIIQRRQWGQFPVILLPTLLLSAQLSVGLLPLPRIGIYLGLFVVLLLIFIIGRRVIPFFIETGVDQKGVEIQNYLFLDAICILSFLLYIGMEISAPIGIWTAWAAAIAGIAHALRLTLWHHPKLWRKPLLWILWIGYASIVLGLFLRAGAMVWASNPFISIHALTYGGIGMITLGMMSRVILGHTGRNVFEPPKILTWIFLSLAIGAFIRVFMPLFLPAAYIDWVITAQILWVVAFTGFLFVFAPMLMLKRIDGRYG